MKTKVCSYPLWGALAVEVLLVQVFLQFYSLSVYCVYSGEYIYRTLTIYNCTDAAIFVALCICVYEILLEMRKIIYGKLNQIIY